MTGSPRADRALWADRVLDGRGGRLDGGAAVLISNGQIDGVVPCAGDDAELAARGAHVTRFEDATIMPGLIDAHVHLVGWRSPDPAAVLTEPRELRTLRAGADLMVLLKHGFTTIRDMGSADGLVLRQAVAEGVLVGPRILSAGRMLCQTAGNGDSLLSIEPEEMERFGWLAMLVDGVDECRRAVRRLVRMGADLIKICTSGGGASPRGGADEVQFTLDEVHALVDEAHRAHRKVAAHAHNLVSIRNALDAGADTIEHGSDIDDECCARMVAEDKVLVATIANIKAFAEEGQRLGVDPLIVERAHVSLAKKSEALMRAFDAGVTIAHGGDTGGAPPARHGINAVNLQIFGEAGMPAAEVLKTATSNAAKALGLDSEIGALAPGMRADVLVIGGDPERDLSLLSRPEAIRLVMRDGQSVVENI